MSEEETVCLKKHMQRRRNRALLRVNRRRRVKDQVKVPVLARARAAAAVLAAVLAAAASSFAVRRSEIGRAHV